MYALKLELKLNNKERTYLSQCAGYARFVWNYGLGLYNQIHHQGIKGSSSKKIEAIQKVFNNYLKKQPEYQWIKPA